MTKKDGRMIVGTEGNWRMKELLDEARMLVAVLSEASSYLLVDDETINLIEAKGQKIGEKAQRLVDGMRERRRTRESEDEV